MTDVPQQIIRDSSPLFPWVVPAPGERMVPREDVTPPRSRRKRSRRLRPFLRSFSPDLQTLRIVDASYALRQLRQYKIVQGLDIKNGPCVFLDPTRRTFRFQNCCFRDGLEIRASQEVFGSQFVFESCLFGPTLILDVPTALISLTGCAAARLEIGSGLVDRLEIRSSKRTSCFFQHMAFCGPIRQHMHVSCRAEEAVFAEDFAPPPLGEAVHWSVDWLQSIDLATVSVDWRAFLQARHPSLFDSDLSSLNQLPLGQ